LCNLRSKKFKTLTYSRLGEITRGPVSQAARNQGYTKQSTINNSKQNSPTPAKDRHSRKVFDLGVNDKTLQTLQTLQCCDTTTITIGHTSSAAASGKLASDATAERLQWLQLVSDQNVPGTKHLL